MKMIISGKNIDVTPGLRSAVEAKLGKLERYFTADTDAPLPKWQTMIFRSFLSFPRISAALFDTKSWLVPWKP